MCIYVYIYAYIYPPTVRSWYYSALYASARKTNSHKGVLTDLLSLRQCSHTISVRV